MAAHIRGAQASTEARHGSRLTGGQGTQSVTFAFWLQKA